MKHLAWFRILVAAAAIGSGVALSQMSAAESSEPLVIERQGSFATGGKVITAPGTFDPIKQGAFNPSGQDSAGQTLHGDHAYAFFQVPAGARSLPLVMWHGHGQSAKTWESTPDGREGFQTIFLRRKFAVYLVDQPRRGRAARGTEAANVSAAPDEQLWFGIFRLGVWPDLYGGMGWATAMKTAKVRAIVSFEPGSNFPFPEGEVPPPVRHVGGLAGGVAVPLSLFKALTRIPIVIYYGDNIPDEPSANPGQDQWRAMLAVARQWRDAVNRHGGNVTVIHLPDVGLRGNTHFPMSDLNNVQVADHMTAFLETHGLTR